MPELPDIVVYLEALERRIGGRTLEKVRIQSPFVVRSVDPRPSALEGRTVRGLSRLGKRIVIAFDDELFLVIHLMIAGRFRWEAPGKKLNAKIGLAAFDFAEGTLVLTEVATRKRASIHIVRGALALAGHDPGGQDPLLATPAEFERALRKENRTLKRALTDPRLFSGIGNAYSDEILHAARLSPLSLTRALKDDDTARLFRACQRTLLDWTERLRRETGTGFPTKVTAFREGMAVHGRFGQPCPTCATAVQRIIYAENEANYCPRCQTGGRLLADRSLSRLMKDDWPRTIDELEADRAARGGPAAD